MNRKVSEIQILIFFFCFTEKFSLLGFELLTIINLNFFVFLFSNFCYVFEQFSVAKQRRISFFVLWN